MNKAIQGKRRFVDCRFGIISILESTTFFIQIVVDCRYVFKLINHMEGRLRTLIR